MCCFRLGNRQFDSKVDKTPEHATKGKIEFDVSQENETDDTGFFKAGHIGGKPTTYFE